ncbi:unnamed protein product [Durusdinium trenchii]|uniref:NADP-dependent oxidoreductase domain-containing protein n=1 Tax=Durusdinium trenchii TaxID=1381693 RepID=A0ABP0PBE9_9DINO
MELLRQQFATQLFREAKAFHSKRSLSPLDTEWLSSATLEDDRSELVQRLRALQSRVQQAEASFVEASDELLEEIREMTASLNEISAVVPKCAARLCFQVEKALAELESRFQAARQVEKEEVGTSLPVTGGHTADILRLSCEQADAVEHPHSLFLQGRSGTGKTLVLIHRIIGRREKAEKEGRPMPSQLFVTKSLLLKDSVVQQLSSAGVPVTSVMGSVASPQSGVMCLSWNQLASHFGAGSAMSFSVFEVQIFPSLQAACGGLSALSAKTVWTEFTCALRPFTGWHWNGISLDDYLKNEVSGQGVQLTPSNRRAIHRAFSMYTIIKERTGQRDEVDAAMTLRDLLSNRSWYDEVYVDEVQDFAPAQLSAFIQMCRRPDGFTVVDWAKANLQVLRYNYRCAPGIRVWANTVTGLLFSRFPRSCDHIEEIGEAKVQEIFLTTKIPGPIGRNATHQMILTETLPKLGMDYVDLVLIHYPCADLKDFPNKCGAAQHAERLDTWRGLQELRSAGKIRAIGVSNYNAEQVEEVIQEFKEVPAVNQVQFHLAYHNETLLKSGVRLEAWASLAGPTASYQQVPSISLTDPRLMALAQRYGVSSAQVELRWETQKGVVPITATCTKAHVLGDLDIFNFTLSAQDMEYLDRLMPTEMEEYA